MNGCPSNRSTSFFLFVFLIKKNHYFLIHVQVAWGRALGVGAESEFPEPVGLRGGEPLGCGCETAEGGAEVAVQAPVVSPRVRRHTGNNGYPRMHKTSVES